MPATPAFPNALSSRPGRRATLAAAACALAAALLPAPAGAQQPFPSRPVRILVGFAAGTGPDIVARLLAQKLSEGWGNLGVIVDNKPGAAGQIAASEAARAAPDGYTLLLAETGQLAIAPATYSRLPYNPRDFVPVSQVVTSDFILLVNPQKTQARNVRDFAADARQRGQLFMATFGAGTPGHFGAYMLGDAIGVKPEAVHYKSTGDAMAGIFGGDVQGVFASAGLAAPNVRSGKLVALASTGRERTPALPEVPTFREQGFAGLAFNSWFGIVAPAKTPPEIVRRLQADIVRAVRSPEGRKKMEEAGFAVTGTTAAEFARVIADDTRTWGRAVAATGFKAD